MNVPSQPPEPSASVPEQRESPRDPSAELPADAGNVSIGSQNLAADSGRPVVSEDTLAIMRVTKMMGFVGAAATIIAAISAVLVGVWTGSPSKGANTIISGSSATAAEQLSVTIKPLRGGRINYPYQTLSGYVSGLGQGQEIWTFSQFPPSNNSNRKSLFYPDTGPCEVAKAKHTWTCTDMTIGDLDETGTYEIWVSVISDQQALDLTQKITCASNAVKLRTDPAITSLGCDTSIAGFFPPNIDGAYADTIAERTG